MTNTIAFSIAAFLAAIIAADLMIFEWDLHITLGRQLVLLLEWLAFWR